MVSQIKSFTSSETQYRVTIDEQQGRAVDCTCPDRYYRGRTCKHMQEFDAELQKAARFILLMRQVSDLEATNRINRDLTFA